MTGERFAAERWFLDRGLPAVLRPGVLVQRVWTRSAPALAAFAVMAASSAATVALTGKHTIDIDGTPTRTEWFVLAIFVLVFPAAGVVGWGEFHSGSGGGHGDHQPRIPPKPKRCSTIMPTHSLALGAS